MEAIPASIGSYLTNLFSTIPELRLRDAPPPSVISSSLSSIKRRAKEAMNLRTGRAFDLFTVQRPLMNRNRYPASTCE